VWDVPAISTLGSTLGRHLFQDCSTLWVLPYTKKQRVYPKPIKDYMWVFLKKVAGLYQKILMQKAIVQIEMA
jgi:hypothetical protein